MSCFREEEDETDKSENDLEQEGINKEGRSRSQSSTLKTPTQPVRNANLLLDRNIVFVEKVC